MSPDYQGAALSNVIYDKKFNEAHDYQDIDIETCNTMTNYLAIIFFVDLAGFVAVVVVDGNTSVALR